MQYLPIVPLESPIEWSIPIHDDKPKFVIIFQQLIKRFSMEFVIAQVKWCIDGFKSAHTKDCFSEIMCDYGGDGSKSMLTRRSFPSSVIIVPQYTTSPFNGTREYNLSRCCVPT